MICKKCGYDNNKSLGISLKKLKNNNDISINLKDFSSKELKLNKNGKNYIIHKLIYEGKIRK